MDFFIRVFQILSFKNTLGMANMIFVGVFYNKEVSNEVEIKVFCLFVSQKVHSQVLPLSKLREKDF